jgi:signal transduction histidine kinase
MSGFTGTADAWAGRPRIAGDVNARGRTGAGRSPVPGAAGRRAEADRGRGSAYGRLRWPLLAVCAAGAAITLLVSVGPFARLAYRSPAAHVAIDTAATVISVLAAFLLFERLRQTALRADLVLAAALTLLALANLCLSVVPALAGPDAQPGASWALLAARLIGAGRLAAAAFVAPRRLRRPSATARRTLLGCVAAVAVLALLAVLAGGGLPLPIDPLLSPASAGRPAVAGNPLALAAQLVGMVLLACAGAGFARRAAAERDELMAWLAIGAILAAFARLNYFLFPSQYTDFLYTGDVFTLASCLVLLVGAARQIQAHHRGLAGTAVLEERRRIARDLHDGLAQELAFIVSQSRGPAAPGRLALLASAAERALDDSRAAIAALTRPLDEPLDAALARVAEDVAERLGIRPTLALDPGVDVTPPLREALLRIAREGITNAVRHGSAQAVTVSLSQARDVTLTIADDGCGFDTSAPPRRAGGGFGLISMRERAEALGGALALNSVPGCGTTLEVVIPCR